MEKQSINKVILSYIQMDGGARGTFSWQVATVLVPFQPLKNHSAGSFTVLYRVLSRKTNITGDI